LPRSWPISVVDTSALVKLLVDEPGTATVDQLWVASTSVVSCEIGYVQARASLGPALRNPHVTPAGRIPP
jgi:hypothetical protein